MSGDGSDDAYSLAARLLRSAREQAGLTQAEFAERVGVPRSMVSAYERGIRQATVPTLQRLLRAVGYEVELVMVRVGEDSVDRAARQSTAHGSTTEPGSERRDQVTGEETGQRPQ